jgi:hypothetical protein
MHALRHPEDPMTIRALCSTGVLVACCVAQDTLAGQCSFAPSAASRVSWWPRRYVGGVNPITAAERAAVEATLDRAEALVRNTEFGTPRGYEILPWSEYDGPLDRSRLSPFGLHVQLQCPTKAMGKDHPADVEIIFNPTPLRWSDGDRPIRDENGDGLYFERVRTATRFGAFATYGDFDEKKRVDTEGLFVLFTAGGESPTLPVSREEYLRAMIFTLEGKNQEKIKKAATAKSQLYQDWLDRTEQRKKEHEQIVATVAATDPAQAARLRKDYEKLERETAEEFKKSEAQAREVGAKIALPGDRFRAQIAAMSPQERASPAWVFGTQELVPAGTPHAMMVVRANPAFYRARRSPFEPRAVLVHLSVGWNEIMPMYQQMYRQLDWAALKQLVSSR